MKFDVEVSGGPEGHEALEGFIKLVARLTEEGGPDVGFYCVGDELHHYIDNHFANPLQFRRLVNQHHREAFETANSGAGHSLRMADFEKGGMQPTLTFAGSNSAKKAPPQPAAASRTIGAKPKQAVAETPKSATERLLEQRIAECEGSAPIPIKRVASSTTTPSSSTANAPETGWASPAAKGAAKGGASSNMVYTHISRLKESVRQEKFGAVENDQLVEILLKEKAEASSYNIVEHDFSAAKSAIQNWNTAEGDQFFAVNQGMAKAFAKTLHKKGAGAFQYLPDALRLFTEDEARKDKASAGRADA